MEKKYYDVYKILDAVKYFGSVTAMAKELGVSRNSVYRWIREDYAPSKYNCMLIEKLTNGEIKASDILDIEWK